MPFKRDEAYAALASLNPAPVFLESYRSWRLPENLDLHFGPPEEFFLAPESQERYTRNRLVPILDDGNFSRITFLDPTTRELVQIHVEFPDESRRTFADWRGYLGDLMAGIAEFCDGDESHLRRMAHLLGIDRIEELLIG